METFFYGYPCDHNDEFTCYSCVTQRKIFVPKEKGVKYKLHEFFVPYDVSKTGSGIDSIRFKDIQRAEEERTFCVLMDSRGNFSSDRLPFRYSILYAKKTER